MREDEFRKRIRKLANEAVKDGTENFAQRLDELTKPDTSRIPLEGSTPYGRAGRTNPAWERAYTHLHRLEPELKTWRTPKHDIESRDFIRAVVTNDQAKLREIADRPHNRAEAARWARADLAIGTKSATPHPGSASRPTPSWPSSATPWNESRPCARTVSSSVRDDSPEIAAAAPSWACRKSGPAPPPPRSDLDGETRSGSRLLARSRSRG